MNDLQKILLQIIYQISNVENIFNHGNSTTKGLRNYIARYSLASDSYYITTLAEKKFNDESVKTPLTRSSLKKKDFIYEHAIPVSLILNKIKLSDKSEETIKGILSDTDCVVIVTKNEDEKLNKQYKSSMPNNADITTSNQFLRYTENDIDISTNKWPVEGALKR